MIFVVKEEDKGLYREIKGRIRRLQSGGTLDSIARLGVDTAGQNGASFFSLRDLARCYEKNQVVARMLWGDHLREEQIVALLLLPTPSESSPDKKNPRVAVKNFATAEEESNYEKGKAVVAELEPHTENGNAVTREIESYREKEKAVSKGIDSFAEEGKAATREIEPYREKKKAVVAEVNALIAEAVNLEVAEYAGSQWIAGLRNCEEILCANFEISTQLLPSNNSETTTERTTTPVAKTNAASKSSKTTKESSTSPLTNTKALSKSEKIDESKTETLNSNAQLLIGVAMLGAAARLIAMKNHNAPEIAKRWILRHYDDSYLEMLAERQRIRL